MKWLKILGSVLLAVVLLPLIVLFLLGFRSDANQSHSSTTIHQRPEAIWPWLYEPDKLKAWVSWMVEARRDPPGAPVVGSQGVWVMEDRNNNNMRMEIASRVEAVEPAHRLVLQLEAKDEFRGDATYVLTDLGNGDTRLDVDNHYNLDNWFAKLMMPVVKIAARQKAESDLAHLRSLVESAK